MATIPITFNADERITQSFERVCSDVGMTVSAAFNVLMRTALREQRVLFGEVDTSIINTTAFQQKQRKAAYDFIASNNTANEELTDNDFAELESGKYKFSIGNRGLDL